MAKLLDVADQYHRPMSRAAARTLATKLSSASVPPTERTLRFPLTSKSIRVLANAINAVDTSGLPPVTQKQLRDPWTQKTVRRLQAVVVP